MEMESLRRTSSCCEVKCKEKLSSCVGELRVATKTSEFFSRQDCLSLVSSLICFYNADGEWVESGKSGGV